MFGKIEDASKSNSVAMFPRFLNTSYTWVKMFLKHIGKTSVAKLEGCKIVFSIWYVQLHVQKPVHVSLVWCVWVACATSVCDIYCLGHWNKKKMKERTKASNLIVDHFSLTFINSSLVWMLYIHVWLRNKGKFLVWSEYYNQFGINLPQYFS